MDDLDLDLDRVIGDRLPAAVDLLSALIEQPSTLGDEAGVLRVLKRAWAEAGFATSRLPIPADVAERPGAGVPRLPYADRFDLVGERAGADGGRSLVVNGHVDVVPAEDASGWSSPPFTPVVRDGWLVGRGAGDMKCGFAAGLLAIGALDEVRPGWLGDGSLTMIAAIEEECTGNGTLASVLAGRTADAALLLEPTDLQLLLAGIGIVWVAIEVDGRPGHAEAALGGVNPILAARTVLGALEALEASMNAEHATCGGDPAFAALAHPYAVSVGTFHAGDWASSVAPTARLEVRVGHPRHWSSEEALDAVRVAVLRACADDAWLAEHPPRLRLSGFRAQGYAQDPGAPLVRTLSAAHAQVHGEPPATATTAATTDARFYLHQAGMPAVAYGPRTRNLHGVDEAVEIASIADAARTVARFLLSWFGAEGRR